MSRLPIPMGWGLRWGIILLIALILAACGGQREVGQFGVPAEHVVQRGDSVYRIARLYGVSQREIIDLNGLRAPFILHPGQVLRLPGGRIYVVRRGDTLSGIAGRVGSTTAQLARINGISDPNRIRVGQVLRLNGGGTTQTAQQPPVPTTRPSSGPTPTSTPPTAPAQDPNETRPGTVLSLPGATGTEDMQPGSGTAGPVPERKPTSQPVIAQPRQQPAAGPTPEPPPRTGRFAWPLQQGRLLEGFGPAGEGRHNDGINVAAPTGTPVLAAETGVVAYSGNAIPGFGNLLLIKHQGGYITAYAHNEVLLVQRGTTVQKGVMIARVGQTGSVSSPQLHFEIRRDGKPVDPRSYLGGSSLIASR